MTTLREQIQERMDSRPDKHTLAWWDEQFANQAKATRGAAHAVNLALAEIEDQSEVVKAQGKALREAQSAIGKLQAEVVHLKELLEKAREAYTDLKDRLPPIQQGEIP